MRPHRTFAVFAALLAGLLLSAAASSASASCRGQDDHVFAVCDAGTCRAAFVIVWRGAASA